MAGRQIDRYRILEQVGSGGMSVVYRGLDTSLDREVAVKVLHPHLAGREESRRRFCREAKAVAKLHHPNILEIFDFSGDEASESFIVTEFIRGSTLRAFAESVAFKPPEIAAMAAHELASALAHAHESGVIHRDLKPENVMLREDGLLKLMDFGIAKVIDRDEKMTMTGALVGSPSHMAPEIIEGQEAGREADVFSLGTLLYWLCCGKLPFQGNNTTQTLKLILDAQYPDPRLECAAVSDELAAIIARCLAREPVDRYRDAGELRDALASLLADSGIERPGEELHAFFDEPDAYRARLQASLVARLLERADKALQAGNQARALDALNRVLALEPLNDRARNLLDSMRRRRQRRRQLLLAAGSLAGIVALSAAGFGAWTLLQPRPAIHPAEPVAAALPPPVVPPAPRTPAIEPAPSSPVAAAEPARPSEPPAPPVRHTAPTRAIALAVEVAHREPKPPEVKLAAAEPLPKGALRVVQNEVDGKNVFWTVKVDDQPMARGLSPFFELQLEPGPHELKVETTCCDPWTKTVLVKPGEQTPPANVRLTPKKARLAVASNQNCRLWVDATPREMIADLGSDELAVPLPEGKLSGKSTIRCTQPGFREFRREVDFEAGQTSRLQVRLERE